MSLNCSEVQEFIGRKKDSSNIETFSSLLLLLPGNLPKHQLSIAKCQRTLPWILQQSRQIVLLHRLLEEFSYHVAVLWSWILTLQKQHWLNVAGHFKITTIEWLWFNVYPFPFTKWNVIGRQILNRFRSWLSHCNRSPCACEQLNVLNENFFWRSCDVFVDPIHNTNPWNCLVFIQGFTHDINTITSFARIDFHTQDWADFRIRTNLPLGRNVLRFRGCGYSRHAVCITSDLSSIVMNNCPFPISFEKPASEQCFDNFWSSRSSANFRSYSCNTFPCANAVELWDMSLALGISVGITKDSQISPSVWFLEPGSNSLQKSATVP